MRTILAIYLGLAAATACPEETDKMITAASESAPRPAGIVMDDDSAEFTGDWVKSTKQPALVGDSYRHDNNREQGKKSARFTPEIPVAGEYEVRLIYVATSKDAKPQDVDGKSYDLVVVGGTASGVACAVRAAREGCTALLVQHNRHIGGMMANGLMQWDALYGGHRAPLFTELLKNIERHYSATYGENSRDHQIVRYTHQHYPIGWAEPHVAEREFNRLVAGEQNITLLLGHYPTAVERDGARLRSVTLREYGGKQEVHVRGAMFADATYEGDLFALAKVPYRCGREARDEYDEPHAGKVFCNIASGPAPRDAVEGRLNIRPYGSHQGSLDPTSPFTADRAVQAYNYRFCVTKDPANRILLSAPPADYNREEYVHYNRKGIATNAGPNLKSHMNSPILPGENHDYPEADWPMREKIIQRHLDFALGLMWFLQNDESVPPSQRPAFREWGLPRDEFADNQHVPYEMYVREARRIVGRHVYSEHDNSLAPGLGRTPVHPDSIAVTDWYMDSHACTTESRPGFHYDGKLILTEESRPGLDLQAERPKVSSQGSQRGLKIHPRAGLSPLFHWFPRLDSGLSEEIKFPITHSLR